jgi:hypothetical protein
LSGPEEPLRYVTDGGESNLSKTCLVDLVQAVTERGKSFRVKAPGFSMYPFIRNLDTITISPLPAAGPRTGDVVAFLKPSTCSLVVHRVIAVTKDGYLIRGDNTLEPDGLLQRCSILGQVTRVEHEGRTVFFGGGPERSLVAFLSRRGFISPSVHLTYRLISPVFRRIRVWI